MTDFFRSILFAPGNEKRKMEKACMSHADQVVFDIEDTVPPAQKDDAIKEIISFLEHPAAKQRPFYVRINGLDTQRCYSDMKALVRNGIKGFIFPMVETAAHCHIINWAISQLEKDAGMQLGTMDIIPTIESAISFKNLHKICRAAERMKRLSFGSWDFCTDINAQWTPQEENLNLARQQLVVAARAGGLEAPIDTSYPVINDTEGLSKSIERVRGMGYQGKACIHPNQVELVNDGFLPNSKEYELAQEVIIRFEQANKDGTAALQVQGAFIDYPMYVKAKRTVALTETIRNKNN